ncbi:MAG: hypothetical protein EBV41_05305 [Actinobacteria bacterium]|nr:hypothetical protein [Actinomycetota bacterium]
MRGAEDRCLGAGRVAVHHSAVGARNVALAIDAIVGVKQVVKGLLTPIARRSIGALQTNFKVVTNRKSEKGKEFE